MYRLYLFYHFIILWISGVELNSGSTPLYSFQELSKVDVGDSSFNGIEDLVGDKLKPGGLIASDGDNVVEISANGTVTVIAGSTVQDGYRDGDAATSLFSQIVDVFPYKDGSELLVADFQNHCIRKIRRTSGLVSTYAGVCTRSGTFVNSTASTALLSNVKNIIHIDKEDMFYYVLETSIVQHNILTDDVSLAYDGLPPIHSAIIDSTSRYLYVAHSSGVGISKIDRHSGVRTTVAGYGMNSNQVVIANVDGTLSEAKFNDFIAEINWLIPDQILVLGEEGSSLRVINLVDNEVITICKGSGEEETYKVGDLSECSLYDPLALTVVDGTIYTTSYTVDSEYEGDNILKIPFSQPLCGSADILCGENAVSNASDDVYVYTHQQTVECTCLKGYDSQVDRSTLTCARAAHENGTVYGAWEGQTLHCKEEKTENMSATLSIPAYLLYTSLLFSNFM